MKTPSESSTRGIAPARSRPEGNRLLHYDARGNRTDLSHGLGLACRHEAVGPFRDRGIDSFGYEPSEGDDEWFAFDWYTLVFEVTA